MTSSEANSPAPQILASMAVFAWNEEEIISSTLNSIFEQSLFAELALRGEVCEVLCVVNGCSDRTPIIAQEIFDWQSKVHPHRAAFRCRVENLAQPGKLKAWNVFVHSLSAKTARYLFMLDADIAIASPTLWSMLKTLESDSEASIAVDQPRKNIAHKKRKSWRERISLNASLTTQSAPAQLCAQLYCIKSEIARNIYLPNDLSACEDGFIKALVCTDFLTHEVWPGRIRMAQNAHHTFEAYTSAGDILKNQKRQIIGQTMVHLILDKALKNLPASEKQRMVDTLREMDTEDPMWLKRLIAEHLRQTRWFWRLYPGLVAHRFKRLRSLRPGQKLVCLPTALLSLPIALIACAMAHRFLKTGSTQYWPQARRSVGGLHPTSRDGAWALKTESVKLD